MASKSKHRRFFRSEDQERIKEPEHEEIGKIETKKLLDYLQTIYGIDSKLFDNLILLKKGKDVWITNKATKNFLAYNKNITINSLGMRAIRNAFDVPKLTTNFVLYLNDKIRKNYYDMNEKDVENYTHGYSIKMAYNNEFRNYLVMKYKGQSFGVGLISNDEIKSQLPKGRVLKNQLNIKEEKEIDE